MDIPLIFLSGEGENDTGVLSGLRDRSADDEEARTVTKVLVSTVRLMTEDF